jgi:triosephosphate isomerase
VLVDRGLALPEINGALIGGASLKATELQSIISAAERTTEPSLAACDLA